MKKLLTICLLIATAFTVNAQEMSIEETVKYINDKIACCGIDKFIFKCTTSGNIIVKNPSYVDETIVNIFDLSIEPPAIYEKGDFKINNGVSLYETYISFNLTKTRSISFNSFSTRADAERVYKALLHLRSLCTKEKDPFDK